jgi:hypothetical protein
MCPSRDRPKQLADMLRSCIQTAPKVDVAVYLDDDQRTLYGWVEQPGVPKQLKAKFGPRVGPVASINDLARSYPGYDVYGFVLDDCRFGTVGWDKWVDQHEGLFLVSPAKNTGSHGDMMFVSRSWMDALGWFAWPGCYHWGWDAIMASLAHAAGVFHQAEPGEFWITHDVLGPTNRDKYPADIVQLYVFFSDHFAGELAKLKEARETAQSDLGVLRQPQPA